MKPYLNAVLNVSISIFAVTANMSCERQNKIADPQGNSYTITKIGEQVWMAENLKTDVGAGSYCYNDDPNQCIEMGRLYTWDAAIKASLQIKGWHIPTKNEWQELISVCGGDTAGYASITSERIGFNPSWSGVRISTGEYKGKEFKGVNYWSSTLADTNSNYAFSVAILSQLKLISPHNYPIVNACSVRLVRDR
jgi:uncharacterized protein (TIGR02145 family)